MNSPNISNFLRIVERSIFHVLRKKLVAYGYLPDVTLYPNTQAGYTQFNQALVNIKNMKGYAIELFGVGSSQSKYMLKVPRIVIVSFGLLPGDIGVRTEYDEAYTVNGVTRIRRKMLLTTSRDYNFEIHIIAKSAEQSRVTQSIVALSIPNLGYIPQYGSTTRYLSVQNTGNRTIPILQEGLEEHVLSFTMKDLYEVEETVVDTNLAPINTIDVDMHFGDEDTTMPPDDNIHLETP